MTVTQNYFISNPLKMTANKFLNLYQRVVANAVIDQNVVNMNRILHDRCGVTISPYCDKLCITTTDGIDKA
jgi:hypothetical protein